MIAKQIRNCQQCVSLKLLDDAKKMIDAGEDVFNLSIEDPSFYCQDKKEIVSKTENYLSLEEKISEKLRIENSLDYSKEEIMITNGLRSSLSIALKTILNPSDEVIIPIPYATAYPQIVKLSGGEPILLSLKPSNNYKLTKGDLKKIITPRTRCLILNNPVNPTGVIYSIDELLELSEIIIEKKLILISDETYEPYIFEDKNHISIASLNSQIKDLTILINDFSAYTKEVQSNLSYIAANKIIINGMKKIQNYMVSPPGEFMKQKTLKAMEYQEIDKRIEFLDQQRREMFFYLDKIKKIDYIKSQSAFYVLVDISEVLKMKKNAINSETSLGFCEALLERSRTLAMPGEIFGMPKTICLCFAVNFLEKGMENLIEFIEKY